MLAEAVAEAFYFFKPAAAVIFGGDNHPADAGDAHGTDTGEAEDGAFHNIFTRRTEDKAINKRRAVHSDNKAGGFSSEKATVEIGLSEFESETGKPHSVKKAF